MPKKYPIYPQEVIKGDEATYSPRKIQHSILASQRGTDYTKRIETDEENNVFVHVAKDSVSTSNVLYNEIKNVPNSTLSTIITHIASKDLTISKIGCSGSCYAKFLLCLNLNIIETKRSSPSRNVEFVFNKPLLIKKDDIIELKVIHEYTNELHDFEVSIYGD